MIDRVLNGVQEKRNPGPRDTLSDSLFKHFTGNFITCLDICWVSYWFILVIIIFREINLLRNILFLTVIATIFWWEKLGETTQARITFYAKENMNRRKDMC